MDSLREPGSDGTSRKRCSGTPERELRRRLLHPLGSTWSEMPESNGGEIKPPASQQQQQPGPSVATEDVTDSSEVSVRAGDVGGVGTT